jgi:hypothetical protein
VRLTGARKNLIERYMIDADEAAAGERAAAAMAEQAAAAAEARRSAEAARRDAEQRARAEAGDAQNGAAPAAESGPDLPIYAWVHAAKTNNGKDRNAEWPRALVEPRRANGQLASDRD